MSCNDMQAAVSRAFDKWAANSRLIKFLDVTEECRKLGLNYGPLQVHKYGHGGCPLAEIWVTAMNNTAPARRLEEERDQRRLQANTNEVLVFDGFENLEGGQAIATAKPIARITSSFRYTSGERPFTLASDGVSKVRRRAIPAP